MKKYCSALLTLAFAFTFTLTCQKALAQQLCAGTSCSCGGSIIAGPCASGWCCKPNVADCVCSFYSSQCKCGPGSAGAHTDPTASVVPPVNEQNALDFAAYFNSFEFSSTQSKEIAAKLSTLIASSQNNDSALYELTASRLELLSRNLPPGEKSKANAWVAGKGGTIFIE